MTLEISRPMAWSAGAGAVTLGLVRCGAVRGVRGGGDYVTRMAPVMPLVLVPWSEQ